MAGEFLQFDCRMGRWGQGNPELSVGQAGGDGANRPIPIGPASSVPTGPSVDPVYTTLRRGSKGDDVRECQGILARLGYDLGKCGVDGDFGKCTEAAVRKYQKERGLTVDGIVGPMTWAALIKEE